MFQTTFRFSWLEKCFFFCINSSKKAIKSVHCRLIKQNSLSALDEMLAGLDQFIWHYSNVNVNEATHSYLIELIMNLNLAVPFEQKPYLLRKGQISRKGNTIIHLVDKIKCPFNSIRFRNFVKNQIKRAKIIFCP